MRSSGYVFFYLLLLVLLITVFSLSSVVVAEPSSGSPRRDTHADFPPLWMEYRRIRETTKLDSPEYRAAIEQVLADFQKHDGVDKFEFTLRRQLGLSYRSAKNYAKSTEILSGILGKESDSEAQALCMFLTALNARDSNDIGMAQKLLIEIVEKYPKTSICYSTQMELRKSIYPRYVPKSQRGKGNSWKKFLIGVNLAAVVVLACICVSRQVKKRARLAN